MIDVIEYCIVPLNQIPCGSGVARMVAAGIFNDLSRKVRAALGKDAG